MSSAQANELETHLSAIKVDILFCFVYQLLITLRLSRKIRFNNINSFSSLCIAGPFKDCYFYKFELDPSCLLSEGGSSPSSVSLPVRQLFYWRQTPADNLWQQHRQCEGCTQQTRRRRRRRRRRWRAGDRISSILTAFARSR